LIGRKQNDFGSFKNFQGGKPPPAQDRLSTWNLEYLEHQNFSNICSLITQYWILDTLKITGIIKYWQVFKSYSRTRSL